MRNGLVVQKEGFFLARVKCKGNILDQRGMCWNKDIQTARFFENSEKAYRLAKLTGGAAKIVRDGKVAS